VQAPFEPTLSSEFDASNFDEEPDSPDDGADAMQGDTPQPALRRMFAGFTFKHAHWMASMAHANERTYAPTAAVPLPTPDANAAARPTAGPLATTGGGVSAAAGRSETVISMGDVLAV